VFVCVNHLLEKLGERSRTKSKKDGIREDEVYYVYQKVGLVFLSTPRSKLLRSRVVNVISHCETLILHCKGYLYTII